LVEILNEETLLKKVILELTWATRKSGVGVRRSEIDAWSAVVVERA